MTAFLTACTAVAALATVGICLLTVRDVRRSRRR